MIEGLSIALIGPNEERRRAASDVLARSQSGVIREFSTYPPSLSDVPKLLEQHYDVIVIDLDSNPEYALELVETICVRGAATVMVYSEKADSDQLVRCMRAGAREFLTLPFSGNMVAEALVRAAVRRPPARPSAKKAVGKLMVFLGAKGGDGVTTLACNFAVSMAKESGQSTLLIDLDLPLGDAALNLGVVAEYSAINALQNAARLDSAFLSKLLVKHSSGVSVLAAPGKFPQFDATHDAIDRLLAVARQDFDNVVIDMGSRLDLMGTSLFKDGSTIYLVIQAGIAGLRNSNRLISQYFSTDVPKLEIVLNRYQSRTLGVAEDQIAKALTRPAQWKIPNDYAAVRRMQHTAVPLALEDSPISRLIRQMARTASGLPAIPEKGSAEKGSGFSLKNLGRSFTSKMSSSEEQAAVSKPEPVAIPAPIAQEAAALAPGVPDSAAPAESSVGAVSVSAAEAQPATEKQPLPPPAEAAEVSGAKAEESAEFSAPAQPGEAETRTYRGATYVKGADGKWYLRKTQAGAGNEAAEEAVKQQTPVITWTAPVPVEFGAKLSSAELNATASVPGKFVYTPAEGEALTVGEHSLTAVFTPEDAKGYTMAQTAVALTVTKAAAAITWTTPTPIAYGTALGDSQLNAVASVPGELAYTPGAGEVLAAGEHTLSVSFTPSDCVSYATAAVTVQLSVTKAAVAITWATPAPIAYGAALGSLQLNATASASGEFAYAPAAGGVLTAGEHTLSVLFKPLDAANYTSAEGAVLLTVTKATPIILWPAGEAIAEGTALSGDQLNATALVEGSFEYTPGAGEVLVAGTHTLSVTFTPKAEGEYNSVQSSLLLTVTEAAPATEALAPERGDGSVEVDFSPLEAASEQPSAIEENPETQTALLAVETPAAEVPAEVAHEAQAALAVEVPAEAIAEPVTERATEPEIEAADAALAETPATTDIEAEAALAVEALSDLATEPAVEPVVETVEAVSEEAPVESPAETETASVVEALIEPVIEPEAEPVIEPMIEAAASVSEEASAEPEAAVEVAPAVEASSEPVAEPAAEPMIETVEADPVEPPAIQAAEAKLARVETNAEAPEQGLVKIPPPKFTFEAGSGLNLMGTAVFPDGTMIYLVMQPGSGGQVDSQRLVSQFLTGGELKPEIVINRYEPHPFGEGEEPPRNDLAQAGDPPVAAQMDAAVQPASRLAAAPEKKKGFLNGLRRSLWAKVASNEKTKEFTHLDLRPDPTVAAAVPFAATAQVRVSSGAVSFAATLPVDEPETAATRARVEAEQAQQVEAYSAPASEVETRTYQGATYAKGADGKWHLQQTASQAVKRETPPATASVLAAVESAPAEAAPAQAEPVLVVPAQTAAIETYPSPLAATPAEAQAAEAEAAVLRVEEQAPNEVAGPPVSAEPDALIEAEPLAVAAKVEPEKVEPKQVEPEQKAAEVESEPPVKAQTKAVLVPAKKPVKTATPANRKPAAKTAAKAKPKAKAAAKPKTKAPAKPAAKTAVKAKKAVKAPLKSAAKAKKAVKSPAKTSAKGKKPVKNLVKAKASSKAVPKSKRNVKAPAKKAVKSSKPVKSLPKTVAKAKKPVKTASKATAKAAVRKAVKSPAKPAAKKKAAKAHARKPAKKR
jgi:pilus assembly protein CpaE